MSDLPLATVKRLINRTSDDRVIVLPTSGILVNASKEEKVVKVMKSYI